MPNCERHLRYTSGGIRGSRGFRFPASFRFCWRHEPFDGGMEVLRREVAIPRDHAERLPASEHLHCAEINAGHNQPRGKGVAITMPRVAVQSARVAPGIPKCGLAAFDSSTEEPHGLAIRQREDRLACIIWPPAPRAQIEKGRSDGGVQRHLARGTVL